MFAPNDSQVLTLVAAAIRAPSADNQHHVRFQARHDGLTVRTDASFSRTSEPHRRLLTLLSFGAVVENLRLRLSQFGYRFEPAWFPDSLDASVLLRLMWSDLTPVSVPDPLADAIESRHTNRRFFRGPAMSDSELHGLDAAAEVVLGTRLHWCDRATERRALLRQIRIAETARFGSRVLHAEMFGSIAFDAGWSDATDERLAPATLEVERSLRTPFAWMRHWSVMRAAKLLGAHHILGLRAGALPARLSPHLGVLTSPLEPTAAALAVGAAFQRLWLAAERAGLALQPMVASAILATPDAAARGASAEIQRSLQAGWRPLVGDARPLVVFRVGRAKRPAVMSGRRPPASYMD